MLLSHVPATSALLVGLKRVTNSSETLAVCLLSSLKFAFNSSAFTPVCEQKCARVISMCGQGHMHICCETPDETDSMMQHAQYACRGLYWMRGSVGRATNNVDIERRHALQRIESTHVSCLHAFVPDATLHGSFSSEHIMPTQRMDQAL